MVDRFNKLTHFFPCKTTYDASYVAYLIFKEIVWIHGLTLTIVSDRDVKFVGHFWRTLWKKLGMNLSFSSFYHPQTDGQTEVVNRSLGNLLRCLTRQHGERWDSILSQTKFSPNDTMNRSTSKSPFQIVYGIHSGGVLELREIPQGEPISANGETFANAIQEIHDQVKTHLQQSAKRYKAHANKKKRDVQFDVGDLVWVHLKKERLPKGRYTKLMQRKIGPCQILKKCGSNSYELQLPSNLGLSPIFNVCDLTLYKCSVDAGKDTMQDIANDNIPKHEPPKLHKVIDNKVSKKTKSKFYMEYLVAWKGQPDTEAV